MPARGSAESRPRRRLYPANAGIRFQCYKSRCGTERCRRSCPGARAERFHRDRLREAGNAYPVDNPATLPIENPAGAGLFLSRSVSRVLIAVARQTATANVSP